MIRSPSIARVLFVDRLRRPDGDLSRLKKKCRFFDNVETKGGFYAFDRWRDTTQREKIIRRE